MAIKDTIYSNLRTYAIVVATKLFESDGDIYYTVIQFNCHCINIGIILPHQVSLHPTLGS